MKDTYRRRPLQRRLLAIAILTATILPLSLHAAAPPGGWISKGHVGHDLVGRIWSVEAAAFVPAETVLAAASGADAVFLGETHNNPDHHVLQAHIVAGMAAAGRRPVIAFEQIPRDLQPALDAHLTLDPPDAAGLGAAVGWEDRGWPAWDNYRPIAEAALKARLSLLAADPAEDERREVGRGGFDALNPERRGLLGLDRPYPQPFSDSLAQVMVESHCGLIPAEATGPLVNVQRLRDATLAGTLAEAIRGGADGAVLITGAGHARQDWAAPWYLRLALPGVKSVSIAFLEVREGDKDPALYLEPGPTGERAYDYVWFTPSFAREDPCVAMRERFGAR